MARRGLSAQRKQSLSWIRSKNMVERRGAGEGRGGGGGEGEGLEGRDERGFVGGLRRGE